MWTTPKCMRSCLTVSTFGRLSLVRFWWLLPKLVLLLLIKTLRDTKNSCLLTKKVLSCSKLSWTKWLRSRTSQWIWSSRSSKHKNNTASSACTNTKSILKTKKKSTKLVSSGKIWSKPPTVKTTMSASTKKPTLQSLWPVSPSSKKNSLPSMKSINSRVLAPLTSLSMKVWSC